VPRHSYALTLFLAYLIAFFLLLSVLYALPNIFGSDLAVQVSSAGDKLIAKSDWPLMHLIMPYGLLRVFAVV
jgi:hypothetical protein